MEETLRRLFVPQVMVLASPECKDSLYSSEPLKSNSTINDNNAPIRVCSADQVFNNNASKTTPEMVNTLVEQTKSVSNEQNFYGDFLNKLVQTTIDPSSAQAFETFGHPLACILVVSSDNTSPISALTQLYQQSYADCPESMNPDFIRCVWYIQSGDPPAEDYAAVESQFGPHCIRINGYSQESILDGITQTAEQSVYPYMKKLVSEWQVANNNNKNTSGFGFGKLLKRLVHSGPPRPEFNIFYEVCREMQPHVALIPAPRKSTDPFGKTGVMKTAVPASAIDVQVRRLADVAFALGNYKLAQGAYDSLQKPFGTDQRWSFLAGCCEMSAITTALLGGGENVNNAVDTALYTYISRLNLPAHYLRCVLLVSGCLIENGNQLLAAGLLSTSLLEIDPVYGQGEFPAETAMLMEQIAYAFEQRNWIRKANLWRKLAGIEWERKKNSE